MCSLDNVRRFWLCIRGRKKFVPSVHAGVPGSDRGSHRRGTCQAEGAREEESGRRGRNAAVFFFFIHVWRKMVSRHRFERNLCWLADYRDFFFLIFIFDLYKFINFPYNYLCIHFTWSANDFIPLFFCVQKSVSYSIPSIKRYKLDCESL